MIRNQHIRQTLEMAGRGVPLVRGSRDGYEGRIPSTAMQLRAAQDKASRELQLRQLRRVINGGK